MVIETSAPTRLSAGASSIASKPPLICFSHLRWDFVTQRPQHLMRRFAAERRVFFFEEYIPCDHPLPYLEFHPFPDDKIIVLRPRLPHWWDEAGRTAGLRELLDMLVKSSCDQPPALWFYTPMMFDFASHLKASAVAYDCMDELSGFQYADTRLHVREHELMQRADVVFAGGPSLYDARKDRHPNIHLFSSSVDPSHFAVARGDGSVEPLDQVAMPRPRLGFYGVIDERIDLDLLAAVAKARPEWCFIMIGPVAKIDPALLPRLTNIHWLGSRLYADLPHYLAGWDVALMPFAINEATRFISPTKTPEYLAAGCPVVSTPIADVVARYGALEGVAIAGTAAAFEGACAAALRLPRTGAWRDEADSVLSETSWDRTQAAMAHWLEEVSTLPNRSVATPANDQRPSRPAIMPADRIKPYDVLVVGAGFAGATLAERLACGSGKRVLVVDRRHHIAGNAYDHRDAAGILVHRYGPHIFHTNSQEVFDYLARFTTWRPYEHRVLASVSDKMLPMPINRTTLNDLYGLDLQDDAQAAAFLAGRAEPKADIRTAEDVVVSAVGRELYEIFFRGYTRKQWGLDPSQLDRSVTARVPTRTGTDDRYFLDRFQAMPAHGYTRMFERMLDHENITVQLGTDYRDLGDRALADHTVFSGPIDEFFDYRFGKLPYRSLRFQNETLDKEWAQPVAVVNYPAEETPYTRITEYKHLTGQHHSRTSLGYEYPSEEGDPYYPIPRPDNQAMYRRYEALAAARHDVSFVGRLATYRYYNMDQVVGQALATYRRLVTREAVPAVGEA